MYNNKHHTFTSQYNHKLFFHANRGGNDVIAAIEELRPKVVKVLDPNYDTIQLIRELVPDAILIYRKWVPSQPLGGSPGEAFLIGVDFAEEIAREPVIQSGLVNLVEGYNEILGETAPAEEHQKYNRFQMGFQMGLVNVPVEPIAFNFGTGNMTSTLIMEHYREVLDSHKWLGFHEYDWPFMDRLHKVGLEEGNGGMWLALRYRRIMQPIIAELGDNWSVIVTECGMTQGVHHGADDVGFSYPINTIRGDWGNHPTPISADDYWQTLQWYNSELMKDDYVAAACLFVTGGTGDWESFETIGTITPKIKDFQKVVDNGGNMSDIFVNDVRANDDDSLNLVPRIETFEELKQVFGLDIDTSLGGDIVLPGQRYWKLVGFEVRTGVAAFLSQIKNANGTPADKILVYNHWSSAPPLPSPANPAYFSNAKGGFTDASGVQGAPYSNDAVTGPNGGPYYIWPSADPAGGLRIASDMFSQGGWIGGTDHLTANGIWMDTQKGGETEPPIPGDGAKLVVYNNAGGIEGILTLDPIPSNVGRLALVIDGVEQAHIKYD
jgi:hypothetical protein